MNTNTTANPNIAPQDGPHATLPSSESIYEFEVMFPWDTAWVKTKALTKDGKPFTDATVAWEWWAKLASSDLYSGAQARLVEVTRRVLAPAAEPVEGWATYHRHMALVAADRAKNQS